MLKSRVLNPRFVLIQVRYINESRVPDILLSSKTTLFFLIVWSHVCSISEISFVPFLSLFKKQIICENTPKIPFQVEQIFIFMEYQFNSNSYLENFSWSLSSFMGGFDLGNWDKNTGGNRYDITMPLFGTQFGSLGMRIRYSHSK